MDAATFIFLAMASLCMLPVISAIADAILQPTAYDTFKFKPGDYFRCRQGINFKLSDELGVELAPGGLVVSPGWTERGVHMYHVELNPDHPTIESCVALPEYAMLPSNEWEYGTLTIDPLTGDVMSYDERAEKVAERRRSCQIDILI